MVPRVKIDPELGEHVTETDWPLFSATGAEKVTAAPEFDGAS